MPSLLITPTRVIFSNGVFDSDRGYVRQSSTGNVLWPNNANRSILRSYPSGNSRYVHYKNGIGGVIPISGYQMNPNSLRMQL